MRVRLKLGRLRDLLAASGISQNHWAFRLGLSRGHWSDIVNGKHPYPSAKTRTALLDALGVPFDELFEIEPGRNAAVHAAMAARYLLDREIGHGGMGTVYLARDLRLGRVVAVKVVDAEAVGGVGVRRFLRELGHVSRLQHPHIVPLLDAGEAAGNPFYVMPYVREGSLRDLLAQRVRLSLAEALPVLRGVALALQHAHAHQILHCDVKPGNVLLAAGHAYLADFGIARMLHHEGSEWGRRDGVDSSAGTPAYVSPEQATGQADLDGRSDLYSLGCLAYELLAGRPPFEGRTTVETVARRFLEPAPDLRVAAREVPVAVTAVVRQAMARERDDRPRSVGAFLTSLERAAGTRTPAILTSTRLGFARMVGRTRRRMARVPLSARAGRAAESAMHDLRHAVRGLRRSPAFTATAVLLLALGIGANTAIFSLIDAVMLRALPVRDAQRLERVTVGGRSTFTNPLWEHFRDRQDVFDGTFAFGVGAFDLATGGRQDRVIGHYVSSGYFRSLGIGAVLGRTLTAADEVRGCPGVVVLSDAFWRSHFGRDPGALGRTLSLNGHPFAIVGVAAPGFSGLIVGSDSKFFLPICSDAIIRGSRLRLDHPSTWWLYVFGRPKVGLSADAVRARLAVLGPRLLAATVSPDWDVDRQRTYQEQVLSVVPAPTGLSGLRAAYRTPLYLLMGIVALVLLIACANVANLLLTRVAVRQRELAIRIGLGAGRGRVIRQLLAESLVLATGGAALGLGIALWGSRIVVRLISSTNAINPIVVHLTPDGRVLTFTVVAAVGTALLFGLLPAWRAARVDPQRALRTGGPGAAESLSRLTLGKALVVAQVGLSLVLVVTATLLAGTFRKLVTVDSGFRRERVLLVRADLTYAGVPESHEETLMETLLSRLRALPEVRSASASWFTPLDGNSRNDHYRIEGRASPSSDDALVFENVISPGYFAAIGTPLLAGRDFDDRDRVGAPRVAIVNATFARKFLGSGSPLGRRFTTSDTLAPPFEIVGVVGDARYASLRQEAHPMAFYPLTQNGGGFGNAVFELRTRAGATSIVPTVVAAATGINPGIMVSVRTLGDQVTNSLRRERVLATLSGFFGLLALLLAAIGLYGTLSYGVTRRRREIGIRVALGATRRSVLWLVVQELGRLVSLGLVVGIGAALAATRVLESFLYDLTPTDPSSFAGAVFALVVITGIAGYLPTRRAASRDPMEVLRAD
jgi:putative ABC transport system permease protein